MNSAHVAKDTDLGPIHYSENFRRAKRNVLFWAAVTVLLSIASVDSDASVELTGIARNLSFSQSALVFGSLLVLALMFLAFVRARRLLIATNNHLTYGEDLQAVALRAQVVERDIETAKTEAREALDLLEKQKTESISETITSVDKLIEDTRRIIDAQDTILKDWSLLESNMADLARIDSSEPPQEKEELYLLWQLDRRNAAKQVRRIEGPMAVAREDIRRAVEKKSDPKALLSELESVREGLGAVLAVDVEPITQIDARLKRFADRIERQDKIWYLLFDFWLVVVASVSGLSFAASYLYDQHNLALWLAAKIF
ncbi:MAG: hypothetical protein AAGI28_07630 [Pseudomonadota bacterium]